MKKGRVSSLVPMAAAAASAVTIAHNLSMKSNMATPFFIPPGRGGGAATTDTAFPLAAALPPAAESGTSMVVESPLFILFGIG